ncbi:MAG: hypothetical protein H2042_18215 [Rhizobiales bacterium]|nr:hypothetical protein [Hyphomicrobiales bacterium]
MGSTIGRILGGMCVILLTAFCVQQLWFAATAGMVRAGPRFAGGYYTYLESPGWFWFGTLFYAGTLAGIAACAALLIYFMGDTARWNRWSNRPPRQDESRRQVMQPVPPPFAPECSSLPKPE